MSAPASFGAQRTGEISQYSAHSMSSPACSGQLGHHSHGDGTEKARMKE